MLDSGLLRTAALLALVLGVIVSTRVPAVEEAPYSVALRDENFELREYAPQVLAETVVDSGFSSAGGAAFRKLARYIGGANRGSRRIAMTAPVTQESAGTRIDMTAPVSQERRSAGWAVAFLLPRDFTLESAPQPTDPTVSLRAVPARRVAAASYSGRWSRANYDEALVSLRRWLGERGLREEGEPVWARYNGPMTPWFMRRNEVLIPVATQ